MMEFIHSFAWMVAIPAVAILVALVAGLFAFAFGFLLSILDQK